MRHLQKSGIITLKALGSPIGSRTTQVQEQQLEETKFIAFFMGKKIDIEGKDLYDAKQKAITQLKVPKSKVGLLAVVSAESQRNQDFKFEAVNEENPGLWANIRAKQARGEAPAPKNSQAYKDAVEAGKEINKEQKSVKREALKSIVKEVMQEEAEYEKFFQKVLDKAGKSIPSMSDDEKKAFFNKVDSAWSARGEKNESVNEGIVNEGIGTIAIGIMLAWAGLKVLKFVAKKLFAGIGSNMELTPERLKRATIEMVKSISNETNIGASILMGHYLTKLINADIDSGKIKTINDIEKSMRDYLKSNDSVK